MGAHTVLVELRIADDERREQHMFRGEGDGLKSGAWKPYPHSCDTDDDLPALIEQARDFVHNQHAIHLQPRQGLELIDALNGEESVDMIRLPSLPLGWRITVDGDVLDEGTA